MSSEIRVWRDTDEQEAHECICVLPPTCGGSGLLECAGCGDTLPGCVCGCGGEWHCLGCWDCQGAGDA